MDGQMRERLRYMAAVFVVLGLYLANDDGVLARTVAPAATAATYDDCDEECGPAEACETQCWSYVDQGPPFLTTCGDYSGEPWNGAGNCIGTCGDYYCNEYNDEDPDTCYQDCGECGDDICTESAEDLETCAEDCATCGDDICNRSGGEDCQTCPGDCNPTQAQCQGGTGDDCGGGEFKNSAGSCCLPSYEGSLSICSYCGSNEQCVEVWVNGAPLETPNKVYICLDAREGCGG